MNFRQASITAWSEVMSLTIGMPPNQYIAMNPSTMLMLQEKTYFTDFLVIPRFLSPMKRPVKASPA